MATWTRPCCRGHMSLELDMAFKSPFHVIGLMRPWGLRSPPNLLGGDRNALRTRKTSQGTSWAQLAAKRCEAEGSINDASHFGPFREQPMGPRTFPWLVWRVLRCISVAQEPPGPHQADDVKWTFKCHVELQAHMPSTAGSGPGGHERELLPLF
jgi:hypothetical protein